MFGGPSNTGAIKDTVVQLGPGANACATVGGSHALGPFERQSAIIWDRSGRLSVRAGASYDLTGNARTLLRGAFGTFYDRPFDNLWENLRNNSLILPTFNFQASQRRSSRLKGMR